MVSRCASGRVTLWMEEEGELMGCGEGGKEEKVFVALAMRLGWDLSEMNVR